ncbi:mannitol dehydrogenase family protein [Pigmentiphaga aceris]|uniref:Mannitol dehydrogenase family protein n=2 Tax=Pigmentiphaga aceris TaxID=1940612 RepID=A0A5C0B5U0_9BURK|nr:mannitol dehydrogenase family protein [Pigmentiphaga aceris]
MQRLSATALNGAAQLAAQVPAYDRRALRTGIVHLGIGAFARAHLAAVNEAALHASGDLHWGMVGVSLRQADTRDALAPQDGLYTLALRDADDTGAPRSQLAVIGNLLNVLVAPEDPAAVLALIAAPDTRIVSLTVTEKGYCHDPGTGSLRADHADIVHDLANPDAPRSAIGFIVRGLQARHAAKAGPLTIMSLDNLPSNGHVLRGLVLDFAGRLDADLQQWIAAECRFPCSMVDRIVPRTTDEDRAQISQALGWQDAWPVLGEPFLEWVIEDEFAAGRPQWERGGARFVPDATPFEKLKLRMVNGTHSALAYLGAMAGLATVDQAIAKPALRHYIETLMREEIAPTLPPLPGLDLAAYQARLITRYANPALKHQTRQIAMDGSQKLPQRLLEAIRERLAAGQRITLLALAVAAWLHYLRGVDEAGIAYDIQDPLAAPLHNRVVDAAAMQNEADRVRHLTAFTPVFGSLGQDERFVDAVAVHTASLRNQGVWKTLEAIRG